MLLKLYLVSTVGHSNASDSSRPMTTVGVLSLALDEMDGDHVAVHVSEVSLIPLKVKPNGISAKIKV